MPTQLCGQCYAGACFIWNLQYALCPRQSSVFPNMAVGFIMAVYYVVAPNFAVIIPVVVSVDVDRGC